MTNFMNYYHYIKPIYLICFVMLLSNCAANRNTASFQNVHFDSYAHRVKVQEKSEQLQSSIQDQVITASTSDTPDLYLAAQPKIQLYAARDTVVNEQEAETVVVKEPMAVDTIKVVHAGEIDATSTKNVAKPTKAEKLGNLGFWLVLAGMLMAAALLLIFTSQQFLWPIAAISFLLGGLYCSDSVTRQKKLGSVINVKDTKNDAVGKSRRELRGVGIAIFYIGLMLVFMNLLPLGIILGVTGATIAIANSVRLKKEGVNETKRVTNLSKIGKALFLLVTIGIAIFSTFLLIFLSGMNNN